jgi:tryptophan synthase alpha chain
MSNRINELFATKKNKILSIYFTAGYPNLKDTVKIIQTLENSGVDLIEIGMPFSDPLADGPVIQDSSTIALANGMSIPILFEQIKSIRKTVKIPLILMGYINPIMQYGIEKFARKASAIGIDGVIIPDLPLQEYEEEYKLIFENCNLRNVFLITPQTSTERIKLIDLYSDGFIYMVSSSSTTGSKNGASDSQIGYFDRIKAMKLKNPTMIGFGISDQKSFNKACDYANGAIIGTAFIKALTNIKDVEKATSDFVKSIL